MEKTKKRVRRSPEEAKALILDSAAQRLKEAGPEGLQLAEIAALAGIAHSTVLHHFGSAEGLKAALAKKMVEKLLSDILAVLAEHENAIPDDHAILFRVFQVLSDDGNARLLAWNMLKGIEPEEGREMMEGLFADLIRGITDVLVRGSAVEVPLSPEVADKQARYIILLAALTAVGDGVAGPYISGLLGLKGDAATSEFRDWFADRLLS